MSDSHTAAWRVPAWALALGVAATAPIWVPQSRLAAAQDTAGSRAAPAPEPQCGTVDTTSGATLRANLTTVASPSMRLGMTKGGEATAEVRLGWSDPCTLAESQLESKLIALPGVLTDGEVSVPAEAVRLTNVDVIDKSVRLIINVTRKQVKPGRYTGSLVLQARQDDGMVVARGEIPIVLQRQAAIDDHYKVISPLGVLIFGLMGGLVFGWFRVKALSSPDNGNIKLSKQDLLAARNLVAVIGGIGAGVTAWLVQYIEKPDYRFDVKAGLSLFALVAGPVATTMLTFLNPSATVKASAKVEHPDDGGAQKREEPTGNVAAGAPEPTPAPKAD